MEFVFTDEELKSNKNGFLSARQKELLNAMANSMRKSSKNGVWIIFSFLALGMFIMLAIFLPTLDAQRLKTLGPQMLAGLCFTLIAVLAMIALSLVISSRQAAKLESAQVLSVDGIVRHDSSYSSESGFTSYYVFFGKKRFAFADDMSHVFPEGQNSAYIIPRPGKSSLLCRSKE